MAARHLIGIELLVEGSLVGDALITHARHCSRIKYLKIRSWSNSMRSALLVFAASLALWGAASAQPLPSYVGSPPTAQTEPLASLTLTKAVKLAPDDKSPPTSYLYANGPTGGACNCA